MRTDLCSTLSCFHTTCIQIYTISFVEDFWAVYNNIADAQTIVAGSTYFFFKARAACGLIVWVIHLNATEQEGIKPMWEDEQNKDGGMWTVHAQQNSAKYWEETVCLSVGLWV